MRYGILDGFRGFFLVFMAIVHVDMVVDVTLGKLNHHYAGWVEDAQGFVFISGVVVGLHYGKLLIRRSYGDMSAAIWRRIRTIYSHQFGLIMIFSAAAAVAFSGTGIHPKILDHYLTGDGLFLVSSLLLVNGSTHMGILPMYIYFMIFSPLALAAFHRGYALPVAFLSALIWFIAQTGLVDQFESALVSAFADAGYTISLGIFFNVFGWQIIFFAGLYLGYRVAVGQLDLSFLKSRQCFHAFMITLAALVFFALFDRVVFWDMISADYSQSFLAANERQNFSLVYLVNFAAMLYAVTWIIVAAPGCGVRSLELLGRATGWLFTRRCLVFLGQHSLHVFSFHLLAVYLLACIFEGAALSETLGSFILLATVASLYLPALGHAWLQRRSAGTGPGTQQVAGAASAGSDGGRRLIASR